MRFLAALFCLSIALVSGGADAADWLRPDVSYSATRTLETGNHEITGPLYYDDGKERFEMSVQGEQQVMIRREDKGRLYMVMPKLGMGMELPIGGPKTLPGARDFADLEPQAIGHETVNGEETMKYRVDVSDAGRRGTVYIWASDDGIPLRMEGESPEGRFTMELSDLQRGPQPPELFELPDGLQMLAMPGQ